MSILSETIYERANRPQRKSGTSCLVFAVMECVAVYFIAYQAFANHARIIDFIKGLLS